MADLKQIFDNLWDGAVKWEGAQLFSEDVLREKARGHNRFAYNVDWTSFDKPIDEVIYIPLNRLNTPYQTWKATNWEKVYSNMERIKRGEGLEPIIIGYDYDVHDGHHRLEASKELGLVHIPCVVGGLDSPERTRAIEAYQEVWKGITPELRKSFDEAKHPRDGRGRFTKVYHLTSEKKFKYNPSYHNSQQEMGRGLYTTPAKDAMYWHRALGVANGLGERHQYVQPFDISGASLVHYQEIPKEHKLAQTLINHFGSPDKALEALDKEEKEYITGETFGVRPFEIAQKRLYAKVNGHDGIILEDAKEGTQVLLFDDSKASYEEPMEFDDFMRKRRWGQLEKSQHYINLASEE